MNVIIGELLVSIRGSSREEIDAALERLRVAVNATGVVTTSVSARSRVVRASNPTIAELVPSAVTRIGELLGDGLSICAIAKRLNDEQVAAARGGQWYPKTVATVARQLAANGG